MTTKTRIDLVNQALSNLGLLAAGQVASAEDFDAMDAYVDPVIAELANRDLVTVDDDDAIPAEWFLSIATLLADKASNDFGLPGVPAAPGKDPVLAAETTLREIIYARPTGERQRTEYF